VLDKSAYNKLTQVSHEKIKNVPVKKLISSLIRALIIS